MAVGEILVYKLTVTILTVYLGILPPVVCSTLLWCLAFEVGDLLVMFRESRQKVEVQEALC